MAEHWSLRQTDRRKAQVELLGQLTGLTGDTAAIFDFGLSVAIGQLQERTLVFAKIVDDPTGHYNDLEVHGPTIQAIRAQLCSMLRVDGPQGLTAVTDTMEIHVELYEDQDYIRPLE